MDADRKSTVSSFYGGRKTSYDALAADFPSPTPGRDDASSFFGRESIDPLAGPPKGALRSAGYNQGSFSQQGRPEPLKGGRDEEEELGGGQGWDVYADFNNAGPRYSSAFGMGGDPNAYQSLPGNGTPKAEDASTTSGPVEMVTVPAMGAEWGKDEMHGMTKAGKRERKAEERTRIWRDWTRGNKGGKWLTKRVIVFVAFIVIAIIAVLIGVCLPRVPSFALSNNNPLVSASGQFASDVPTAFSRVPANFSFPAFANLQVDTNSNNLPLRFQHLRAKLYDLDSGFLIATGDLGHRTLKANEFVNVQLPLNFSYVATNDSDTTWLNWYNGCKNKVQFADGKRPVVKFNLVLNMAIAGLVGTYGSSTTVNGAACPIELPTSSV
ncbi:hypothetical protein MIND_00899100 [Mycena indigotica]|uniref:Uncharacterized protein n=1 Tax=Mycena indigotica TaxID=2126181 RepID=A0A8H6SIP4_9AGAR|nr:uncharacterized protein MIND_00899100 [Mycena indigotica]KAF7299490.1 hypothetical protein MIND_00899100 [Mycena indigotica]